MLQFHCPFSVCTFWYLYSTATSALSTLPDSPPSLSYICQTLIHTLEPGISCDYDKHYTRLRNSTQVTIDPSRLWTGWSHTLNATFLVSMRNTSLTTGTNCSIFKHMKSNGLTIATDTPSLYGHLEHSTVHILSITVITNNLSQSHRARTTGSSNRDWGKACRSHLLQIGCGLDTLVPCIPHLQWNHTTSWMITLLGLREHTTNSIRYVHLTPVH